VRERQTNDNEAGRIEAWHQRQDELSQLANNRLALALLEQDWQAIQCSRRPMTD